MIRLHHIPGSRSFRVLWLLEELGLDYDVHLWSLTDGSLRSAEFRALNPSARVPALEIDGTSVWESGAICEYLAEREGRLAPLPGSPGRAEYLSWMHFAETQANGVQSLNIHHIFLRPESARSIPLMKLETKRLASMAKVLEAQLGGRDTLLDTGFSAADCMLGFNIPAMFHFIPRGDYPQISAYWERMTARAGYQRALARDGGPGLFERDFYEIPDA